MTQPMIDLDPSTAMQFLIDVNTLLIQRRVRTRGLLLSPADKRIAREFLLAGSPPSAFVDFLVQRDASRCTCGDTYRQHGQLTGACLAKHGGPFNGGGPQVRCRCRKFTAGSV